MPRQATEKAAGGDLRPPYAGTSVGIPETSTACSACHRSWAACMLSHSAAPLPQSLPNRTAVSGVTGCRPAKMSYSDCREIPISRAISAFGRFSAGITVFSRTMPGCVGARLKLRFVLRFMLGHLAASAIISSAHWFRLLPANLARKAARA